MRKLLSMLLVSGVALVGTSFAASAQTVLRYGQGLSMTDNHQAAGAEVFKEALERLTEGRYTIEIFPSSTLGGEREMAEGLQIGTVDLAQLTIGPLGNWVPEVDMLTVPYLFRDEEHARTVLSGPIGDNLLEKFTADSFIGLAWTEDGGMRHVFNGVRPVRTLEDMQGLKIRVQENRVQTLAFEAWGALPTPMAFPNMFSSIQQGVLDGGELSLTTIRANRFGEVADNLSLTAHFYSAAAYLISPAVWADLTDEDKANFREAARLAAQATYDYVDQSFADNIERLAEMGMETLEDPDRQAFEDAVLPVYQSDYYPMFGQELIESIKATE